MPHYRTIVAEGRWRRFAGAAVAARLTITMAAFGLVLAGRSLGSYALGASMAAAYTLCAALAALWQGRRLDRGDLRTGLARQGVGVGGAAAGLALCVGLHGPRPLAFALAVALGVTTAAISGGYRALLPLSLAGFDVEVVSALDAVCVELCFVVGPGVAAAVAWGAGPAGVFAALAGFAVLGAWATWRLPATGRPVRRAGSATPSLGRSPEMVGILVGAAGLGIALGTFDGAFPALATALGTRASFGGIFVALMALGSAAGGLALGPRLSRRQHLGWVCLALLAAFGLLALPVAAAPDLAVAVVLVLIGGAPFALMSTSASLIVQRTVDPQRSAEAFSLLTAALLVGVSAGTGSVAALIGPVGVRATLIVAAAGPIVAAAGLSLVIARRSARRPLAPAP